MSRENVLPCEINITNFRFGYKAFFKKIIKYNKEVLPYTHFTLPKSYVNVADKRM